MNTVHNRFEVGIQGLMMDGCFRTYNEAKRHAILLASQNPGYRGYVYDRMARITCCELSIFDSDGKLCEVKFRIAPKGVTS